MSTLSLRQLTKRYGSNTLAVDNFSLDVGDGEFVTLLGPSGCGKTTMLRMITGFLRPDAGTIYIGDRDVTRTPAHRRDIGIVYQSYALWPHMTAAKNISFGLEMRNVPRRARAERIDRAISLVGLEGMANRYPHQLSGGQQQRVALARALVIEPEILLLDEPLTSLDATLRVELREHIRSVQRELGVTTLLVTHDQEEALAVSDRIAVMLDGRLIEAGTGEAVYQRPQSEFTMSFMGEINYVEGTVARQDGTAATVDTEGGSITLAADAMPQHDQGDRVRVGLRPEQVLFRNGEVDPDSPVLEGEILSRNFLGPWVKYEVRVGSSTVTVKRPNSADFGIGQTGDHVFLEIDPSSVLVVPGDGEGSRGSG